MTFTGTIQDDELVFTAPVAIPQGTEVRVKSPPVTIPQGTEVRVEAPAAPEGSPGGEREPTFAERYAFFIGKVEGLPNDAARNVDHYLYGHPKRT